MDIAGFCSNTEVVMTFCKHLEKQLLKEKDLQMHGSQPVFIDEEAGRSVKGS